MSVHCGVTAGKSGVATDGTVEKSSCRRARQWAQGGRRGVGGPHTSGGCTNEESVLL